MKAEIKQKRIWVEGESRKFEQKSRRPQRMNDVSRLRRNTNSSLRELCAFCSILLLLSIVPGALAAGFFSESFQQYNIIPTNVAAIGNGWEASSNAVIVTNEVALPSNKVALIVPGEAMWNRVNTNVSPSWIWSDMRLNSTNFMTPDQLPAVGTSAVFMIAMATNGYLYLGNPTSQAWDVCSSDATNGPVTHPASTGDWVRVSVFQNYSNHTVAIYVGGVLIRTNWSFLNTAISACGTLRFDGAANANVSVDDVTVSNAMPAGLNYSDVNNNGLDDSLELTSYGALNVWTGSTIQASVTPAGGGTVTPGSITGIRYNGSNNFTFAANPGYVLDTVSTNGGSAMSYPDHQTKTNSFNWTGITSDGTFQVGFYYNGIRYVPADYGSVTGALAVALTNDQIVVSNGTYEGSITVSNGVALIGTNMTVNPGHTNLTINGGMTVVQTGTVYSAGSRGFLVVTGMVAVPAGGLLTISNTVANFGGLTIGGGGLLHMVNGALIVGSYTNAAGDFTLSLITNRVSFAGVGTISPSGTNTMISTWSNVVYSLQATNTSNIGYTAALTNNGVDVGGSLIPTGLRTWTYTNLASTITNDQTIVADLVYNGVRYVPGDYGTISAAVAAAQGGDVITLASSNYNETVTVASNLTFAGSGLLGLAAFTVQTGVTNAFEGFTNVTMTSLTVASNGVLEVSNSVLNLAELTIQGGAIINCYNSTAIVNGVEYTGDFSLDEFWNSRLQAQPLDFNDGFEAYARGTRLDRLGNTGWWASTSAVTVVENPDSNHNAVSTNAAQVSFGQVVSNQVSASGVQKVWCDFMIRSTGQEDNQDLINTNGASPVMFFVNSNNWLTVLTPSGWDVCSNDVCGGAAPSLAAGAWAEISCFMDFTPSAERVSYFVNGHLVRQRALFARPASSFSGMKVQADNAVVLFDNVNIMTNLPPGVTNWPAGDLDLDHNGIPDALEIYLYGTLLGRGTVFKIR